jgi:glycine/D-amino acid oxidase-like deaminating enzyme/nitrite reductase/ring-hydroxylating ferredoxin subunit
MAENTKLGVSAWEATALVPESSALAEDLQTDVCIVGAGIAGMSAAYELARRGRKVVVLDAGPISAGESRYTTAHLASVLDDRFSTLEEVHGREAVRLAAESHAAAIDRIEGIAAAEQIDCDFERLDGYLFDPVTPTSELLARELATLERAQVGGVELLPRAPLPFNTGPCLRFTRQGQFHPLKYISGLAKSVQREGGRIFTDTRVEEVRGGEHAQVRTQRGPLVRAAAVVVATNTPINDVYAIHTKQAPYMTYALAALLPRAAILRGLYWDTLDPYHYVRLQTLEPGKGPGRDHAETHELLIVGGEDHKTGQARDESARYARLESWARARFPSLGEVLYRWSGQVLETLDGLGYIGRNPGDAANVFIATGDSGMGMTHGVIAGMLLADLATGRDNRWTHLYDPARKPLAASWEYVKENLNVAAQYGDWLTGGDVGTATAVQPVHGAVVRRGLSKVAVYRDEDGTLHECSAVCPHLGCIVHWNRAEQTWDCPCHGSRFTREGHVVHGPAATDLAPVESIPHANSDE